MSSADNDATYLPLGSINPASPSMLWCLLLLQVLLQGAQTDPWTTGSAAIWTPWDSRQESCSFLSKNTELAHMNWKAYLVSRHIPSLILPWHQLQDSIACLLNATSFWYQSTLWRHRGGNEFILLRCSSSGPKWNQGSVALGKLYRLRNTAWPQAHTVQANEGKVEGETEILRNEVTCLRLQRRSVAEAEPKELSKCYSC